MKRRLLFQAAVIGLAALLLMPLLFSGAARADDGGDRETSVNVQGHGGYFTIDSQSTNQVGPRNEYSMVFAANSFLMQFKNDSQKAGYTLQFNIQLLDLLLVGPGNITVLLNFSQQEFSVYQIPSTVNGLSTFALSTESDSATFMMTVQVSNTPTSVLPQNSSTAIQLTPNEVKISFMIQLGKVNDGGFRNQRGGQPPNGSIVLQLGVSSVNSTISQVENMSAYSQIGFTQGMNSGYFSWENSALADGRNVTVNSSFSPAVGTLSLAYPAASTIIHDPYIGISPGTIVNALVSSPGNIVIYAVTLAISAALIGGAVTARRRRG